MLCPSICDVLAMSLNSTTHYQYLLYNYYYVSLQNTFQIDHCKALCGILGRVVYTL